MTRDRRVSPAVSSCSAARVWSMSRNPNAASRSSAAASGSAPTPASVSSSGAKKSFSWIARTTAWWRRCVRVERVERRGARCVAEAEHAREVRARVDVGRDRVRLVLVDELEPVLDRAQPDVRVVELRGVVSA